MTTGSNKTLHVADQGIPVLINGACDGIGVQVMFVDPGSPAFSRCAYGFWVCTDAVPCHDDRFAIM